MSPIFAQHALTILLTAIWWLLVTGAGLLCLRMSSVRAASRGELIFLSSGIGLITVGYSVFLLGVTGALHSLSITVLLLSLFLLSLTGWLNVHSFLPAPADSKNTVSSRLERLAAILLGFLFIAGLLLILAPETGKDALIYHLAVPKLFLKHGGFYFISGNIFADYPLLAEMHYILALFLQNDILAKTMNYAVLCGILLGIGLFSKSVIRDHTFPAMSMLIFFSIPSVFAVSHAAYNDLFVAFFTLAAFYCFLRWSENRLTGWLILFGVFSGAAVACKYNALLIIPLGGLGILFIARRNRITSPETFRALILYAAAVFAVGSPFYLKNWIITGNPFHPFLYVIFGGRGWDADQARLYDLLVQNLGMGRKLIDYLLLPWNLSLRAKMDSIAFDGVLGPVFLFTLPFLIGIRRDISLLLIVVFSFFSFLFWASSAQQIRYLIPLFPLLAVVVGAILTNYRKRKPIYYLLTCLIAASLTYNGYYIVHDFLKINPLRAVAGLESRGNFLGRLIPTYPMYRFANANLPPNAKVFLVYMKNYTFFCERDCYSDSMFETHTLGKIIRGVSSPEEIPDMMQERGFSHIMYDERYVTGDYSPLSADEKKKFLDYRMRFLSLVVGMGPYRVYSLEPQQTGN
jgi:hypothetical protein